MIDETIYVVFRCPKCHSSMEIYAFGRFKCNGCNNDFSPNQAKVELINNKGAEDLQESGVKIYLLAEVSADFSEKFLTALDSLRKSLKEEK